MRTRSKPVKSEIQGLLAEKEFAASRQVLASYPARRIINILISFYCHRDAFVRWRAIEATGQVVSEHARADMESARVIMRRFLWMLNDESGGIGWGVPEAMGETLSLSDRLFSEYHRIFLSYIQPACNYLEHPVLQRGLLWGIGRLAKRRSDAVRPVMEDIYPFMDSEDPYHRGFAVLVAGYAGDPGALSRIEKRLHDTAEIEIYEQSTLMTRTVGELARFAAASR